MGVDVAGQAGGEPRGGDVEPLAGHFDQVGDAGQAASGGVHPTAAVLHHPSAAAVHPAGQVADRGRGRDEALHDRAPRRLGDRVDHWRSVSHG